MKTIVKHSFLFLLFLSACSSSFAQQKLKQVIILNEGYFNYITEQIEVPVTIGAYSLQTGKYTAFDTIWGARFASDVIIDGNYIYAAADTQLVKYDLTTKQRVGTQSIRGIRKMAVWNNQLWVTLGEYGAKYKSYLQQYDKTTLQFVSELDTLTGPKYASDVIVVKDGIAYAAINDFGSGNVGLVGRYDLNSQQYLSEIDLGADGKNPENLMLKGDKLYTLNNKDFIANSSSISEYNVTTTGIVTTNINSSGGCKGSVLVNNNIAFQAYSDNFLGRYNLTTSTVKDTFKINKSIYQIAGDTLNERLYVSETDFKTYGTIFVYDKQGSLLSYFSAGVTPGAFAFDVQDVSGVEDMTSNQADVLVFPTLVKDQLTVATKGREYGNTIVTVTDCLGRVVFSQAGLNRNANLSRIDFSNKASGMYVVTVTTNGHNYTRKIVKM